MNKQMKQVLVTGLVMLGIGAFSRQAFAGTTDTMTVSVTPIPSYGVTISSPYAGGYSFGNVALTGTTMSTLPITLNSVGATAPEYFGLSISNTSGNWSSTVGAPGTDTFRLGAKIAGSQPLMTNVTDYLTAPAFSGTAANLYNQPATSVGSTALVWLRLEMPTQLNVGTTATQTMTLTVTAQGS